MLCALVSGCGRYFAPDRNVKETLSDNDVVGRWKITKTSLDLLARDGFKSESNQTYTISFNKDGTCAFQTVELFSEKPNYISTNGTWKLEHDIKRYEHKPTKNELKFEFVFNGVRHLHKLDFARQDGKLLLWEFYRDPDEWEFMEYAREN